MYRNLLSALVVAGLASAAFSQTVIHHYRHISTMPPDRVIIQRHHLRRYVIVRHRGRLIEKHIGPNIIAWHHHRRHHVTVIHHG